MAYIATTVGASTVTTVDCQKQVRSWRLLRSIMELLIPTCNCTFFLEEQDQSPKCLQQKYPRQQHQQLMTCATITGTIFGYRKGKVSFCIQANSKSSNPILLLELAVPTSVLAKEMRGGNLRIVLESSCNNTNNRTGVINSCKELQHQEDELMYLRANFQRVRGSSNSESFHLIDPEGSIGQELSIFFFRSK
ncbi:hypothetical protein VIGAN_04421500 [Vigna angularis var. angularis]|uniref:Protein MIZU-KUSSEI 1 n=1 Tax=Vigna angularis var. angularis TaxID=157739 RepID=A0A0S3S148_PHAAN|nr:hypothetical protein VIGAN_04421500 [Vigna angularis var. angularis]